MLFLAREETLNHRHGFTMEYNPLAAEAPADHAGRVGQGHLQVPGLCCAEEHGQGAWDHVPPVSSTEQLDFVSSHLREHRWSPAMPLPENGWADGRIQEKKSEKDVSTEP